MKTIARVLVGVGIGAGCLLMLAVAMVTVIVKTETGGRFALRRVLPRLPIAVTVDEYHGTLSGRFVLTGIRVEAPEVRGEIARVEVAWRPSELWNRRLAVQLVDMVGADVTLLAVPEGTDSSAGAVTPPNFPLEIAIDQMFLHESSLTTVDGQRVDVRTVLAAGSPHAWRASADLGTEPAGVGEIDVRLVSSGNLSRAEIDTLDVRALGGRTRVSGTVEWLPSLRWDVRLSADDVSPASLTADSAQWPGTVMLRATMSGEKTDTGIHANVSLDRVAGSIREFALSGEGRFRASETAAEIDTLVLRWGVMAIGLCGSVTWQPELSWSVQVQADSLAPQQFLSANVDLPGTVSLRASSTGKVDARSMIQASVDVDSIFGALRGHPVVGGVRATLNQNRIAVEGTDIHWGQSRISAGGSIDDTIDARVDVAIPDLSEWMAGASGSISAEVRVDGKRDDPRLRIRAAVENASFRDQHVAALNVEGEFQGKDLRGLQLDVVASDIVVGAERVDTATVHVEGSLREPSVTASVAGPRGAIAVRVRGERNGNVWDGALEDLGLKLPVVGEWKTTGPVSFHASAESASLDSLWLVGENGRICAGGEWARSGNSRAIVRIQDLALALADTVLPGGIRIQGFLDADADVRVRSDNIIAANMTVRPRDVRVIQVVDGLTREVAMDSVKIDATIDSTGTSVGVAMRVRAEDNVDVPAAAVIRLPGFHRAAAPDSSQEVSGQIDISIADLSILQGFVAGVARVTGSFDAVVRVAGTIFAPTIHGDVHLNAPTIDIPVVGVEIRDLRVVGHADPDGTAELTGSARSGAGKVTLSTTMVREGDSLKTSIRVDGTRVTAMNTAVARVLISPELHVQISGKAVQVEGTVDVPWAKIEPTELPATAIAESPDVRVIGESQDRSTPLNLYARVRVTLGDSVFFRGFNFEGRFEGSLLAVEEPGMPTTGSGELRIRDGKYRTHGQMLTIEPGRILFGGGPIDNPGLNIRAFRKAQNDVIAGLLITGTARKPNIVVFSEPTMPQTNALSYLLTGRPIEEARGAEGGLVAEAALSIGLQQGSALTRGLGRQVGLDEAGFETTGSMQETSFIVGKYLSPSLYVSHGIALFDRAKTWRANYTLSRHWTLRAESGKATSTDLFYKLERGK